MGPSAALGNYPPLCSGRFSSDRGGGIGGNLLVALFRSNRPDHPIYGRGRPPVAFGALPDADHGPGRRSDAGGRTVDPACDSLHREAFLMMTLAWPWVLALLPLPWIVRRWAPPAPVSTGRALKVPHFDDIMAFESGQQTGKARAKLSSWFW